MFCKYDVWLKYNSKVSNKDIPEELKLLYRTLNNYHDTNEENKDLDIHDLATLFWCNNPKDKEYYEGVFNTLVNHNPDPAITIEFIKSLHRARLLENLSVVSYEVAEGKRPYDEVSLLLDSLKDLEQENKAAVVEEFVTDDLDTLLNHTIKENGLRWRLNSLNRSLGSLRKGDFGFIFARPETGKTTILASEVTHMASQLNEGDGPVLWFNNEEQGEKVKIKVYQAASGITLQELLGNPAKYKDEFLATTKHKIKIKDDAKISKRSVEALCKQYSPSLIVFDQIDKIQGFKADRDDLVLGAIYIWARELAKTYCPVIGICQADATGENQRYLTMNNVANAKTSKQAEADWILGIGAVHDQGWESVRFMNISKNKLFGDSDSDPAMRHGRFEVLIQPQIARYKDIKP